jgi:hypothetical protein
MFKSMTSWFALDKQQACCIPALAAYSYVAGAKINPLTGLYR